MSIEELAEILEKDFHFSSTEALEVAKQFLA